MQLIAYFGEFSLQIFADICNSVTDSCHFFPDILKGISDIYK